MSVFPKPFKDSPNRRQRRRLLETIKVTGLVRIIQGENVVREATAIMEDLVTPLGPGQAAPACPGATQVRAFTK